MKKLLLIILAGFLLIPTAFAQQGFESPEETFFKAKVIEIADEGQVENYGQANHFQDVRLQVLNGEKKGEKIDLRHGGEYDLQPHQLLDENDLVVVSQSNAGREPFYYIAEDYRLDALWIIGLLFVAAVILVAGKQGIMSLVGLLFSIFILVGYVVPNLANGTNPIWITFLGAIAIATVSLFLAHGFKKRTLLSWVSILITIGIAYLLTWFFVDLAHLSGLGTEEAFNLQLNFLPDFDFRGLLMGAIIIGALGLLDDVATAQVATVDELKSANKKLTQKQLYQKAHSVGKEHVSALVNTLALAYFSASFALFVGAYFNTNIPVWVIINNESIMEEIIRTLVGSTALVFAVPISTYLAAHYYSRS